MKIRLSFLFFGIGIGFPLLVFSAISTTKSGTIISFLAKYKRKINLYSGIIMLILKVMLTGLKIKIERNDAGIVKITNTVTGEEIVKERDSGLHGMLSIPILNCT